MSNAPQAPNSDEAGAWIKALEQDPKCLGYYDDLPNGQLSDQLGHYSFISSTDFANVKEAVEALVAGCDHFAVRDPLSYVFDLDQHGKPTGTGHWRIHLSHSSVKPLHVVQAGTVLDAGDTGTFALNMIEGVK